MKGFVRTAMAVLCLAMASQASAQSFQRTDGTRIVDGEGQTVIWRGMGLGGWVLQEGYMLRLSELGQQHVIREQLEGLVGPEATEAFYQAWWDNHATKADIDAMATWGFNSVRLPMHYDQLTLPIDREPVPGQHTWLEPGFERIYRLIQWVKANDMVLILDLHAAPGGQGNDLAISDRDPDKPSLWDSAENRRKTIALWRRLAERYADEPAIAAYDLINEPNWDFTPGGGARGCEEQTNTPLWELQRDITRAIREVDRNHIIVIAGNCWGNNYAGLTDQWPTLWDDNIVISFHKYWNANDRAAIQTILDLRDRTGAPIWLGESGENSNTWFREAIALVESEGVGWNFWPWKKMGFNQPVEIAPNPGWLEIVEYLTGRGPRPDPDRARAALVQLAEHDIRFENNIPHPDVVDAMLRQPHHPTSRPFADHRIGSRTSEIAAVDYDMGPSGVAFADGYFADYNTPSQRRWWNSGRTYRNDGVDITRDPDGSAYVTEFQTGEWMRYTLVAEAAGPHAIALEVRADAPGQVRLTLNGGAPVDIDLPASAEGWTRTAASAVPLLQGRNTLRVEAVRCDCAIRSIRVTAAD